MPSGYYTSSYNNQPQPPFPLHLCFFILTLLLFISFSWYLSYESAIESFFNNIKLCLIVSPLLILLAVHWLSATGDGQCGTTAFIALPERDALHRAGGSLWRVALVLVVVLLMISYQSYFHEFGFHVMPQTTVHHHLHPFASGREAETGDDSEDVEDLRPSKHH